MKKDITEILSNIKDQEFSTIEVMRAHRTVYSVARNPNQSISDVIAVCRCLSCGEDGIKPEHRYCPNCGRMFI